MQDPIEFEANGTKYKTVAFMKGAQAATSASALSKVNIQAVMSLIGKAINFWYASDDNKEMSESSLNVLLANENMAYAVSSFLSEMKDSTLLMTLGSCVIEECEGGLTFATYEEYEEKRKKMESDLLHADESVLWDLFTFFLASNTITRSFSQAYTGLVAGKE